MKWQKDLTLDEEFDNSAWLVKDKAWLKNRKAQWKEVQKHYGYWNEGYADEKLMVKYAKHYFLTGELWMQKSYFESQYSPYIDLFEILWMHPSNNMEDLSRISETLWQKYNTKLSYGLAMLKRVCYGLKDFWGENNEDTKYSITAGLDGLEHDYIKLLLPDPQSQKTGYPEAITLDYEKNDYEGHFASVNLHWLNEVGDWVNNKAADPSANFNMIFQFPEIQQCWLNSLKNEESNSFLKEVKIKDPSILNQISAISTIAHFDFGAEGDTKRAKFVTCMIELFESNTLPQELNDIWQEVKLKPRFPTRAIEYQWPIKLGQGIEADYYQE